MRKLLFFVLTVNSFMHVRGQVNLQTGSAVYDLPMFNWQDDKSRLSSVVSISYNSGNGLKTESVASNVGQGWGLLAGGFVSRMQVGQPDDQKPRDGNYDDIKKYPPGYLYNSVNATSGCPQALIDRPIFGTENIVYRQHNSVDADREQDYFAFQFNGRTGIFVLGKNNGDKGISIGDNKLKISFDRDENASLQGIRTTITGFTIQDENGLLYRFRDKALSKVQRMHYCNPTGYGGFTITGLPGFSPNNVYNEAGFDELGMDEAPYIVNSWYLTEIVDTLTNRRVQFAYVYRNIVSNGGRNMAEYITPSAPGTGIPDKKYVVISNRQTIEKQPEPDVITYPDGHKVNFIYGDARIDFAGDLRLNKVQVSYQDRVISSYTLGQAYFLKRAIGFPSSGDQNSLARLCLLSVKKNSVDLKDEEPPYTFEYNLGSAANDDFVPPPFCEFKDIWGYYNGDMSGVDPNTTLTTFDQCDKVFYHNQGIRYYLSLDIDPKPGYAANGLLKKINYPMGGSMAYQYGQNQGYVYVDGNYGGVHVSSVTMHDGGASTGNDMVTNYSYVLANGASSLWGNEKPYNFNMPQILFHYRPESQYFNGLGCDYSYKYPGILSQEQAVSISSLQNFLITFSQVFGYVSLAYDVVSVIMGIASVVDVAMGAIFYLYGIVVSCSGSGADTYHLNLYYTYNLVSANPLPVQFSRVEEQQGGPGGGNGKTVYEFTDQTDYAVLVPDISGSYSSRQRIASWAYGLPKKITVYDAAGNTVRQTQNDYDFTKVKTDIAASVQSCKCFVKNTYSRGDDSWTDPSYYNTMTNTTTGDLVIDPYTPFTGRVELQYKHERFYKDNNNYLETVTHYEYSPNNYMPTKITTTLSNGDKNVREMYYSADYTNTGILQTMRDNNMLNVPVASYASVQKSGAPSPAYLSANVTDFTTLSNGDIKPATTWSGRSASPIGAYSFNPSNPFNYSGLIATQTYSYDNSGNLVNMKGEGGRSISNLYDYNDKFMVASAVNAEPGEMAYTSFETDNTGQWIINNPAPAAYNSSAAITGARGFDLSGSNSITTSITMGKAYTLSLWSTAAVTVSGASLKRSGPAINGFTFYEYEIAAGSASPTISGSATIDELRLYPRDARMNTSTYDPALGKTSACDVNNRVTYYEYDYFGRVKLIRDENKNIVKMYEYNYKKPQ